MRKVLVCLPAAAQSYMREFVESYTVAKNYLLGNAQILGEEILLTEYFCHTFPIDANRNECVARALDLEVNTTIWLDMDQTFPPDTLIKLLKPDNPIVAGVYYLKKAPFPPVILARHPEDTDRTVFRSIIDFPKDGYFYADCIGMGCCRIDIEVLKKLDMPYFKYRRAPDSEHIPNMQWKIDKGIEDISEDVHFWKQVGDKTDYRIWVDGSLLCGHIHKVVIDHTMADAFLQQQQAAFIQEHGEEAFKEKWASVCKAETIKNAS